ncbi:glutamine synthetase [Arcanobacterium wilhelmae]|uniref:Glutamine synthetase n=1 Tax=Arcanobacterium wilhelmae TaxID=1803177 RepID=A0ABT9N913_9ACTO|nr:glutamine synthetase family protein [Arcanobacterium wilhelmae]MDP9800194.1 glutamine synthetase [Arcanobacterium wilhelmae]WFN89635.1 glutamine synthetase family protein [Arcanobacterium wilhelmae]
MDTQVENVLRQVAEENVRFVRLWFTDVSGTLKSVAVAPAELESAFEEGIGFDGSAVEGLTRVHESDMVMHPDPATFQILPSPSAGGKVARLFCDISTPDGAGARSDPRGVLRRAMEHASSMGFTFYAHPEFEFYLFNPVTDEYEIPTPIDSGSYFDHVSRSTAHDFRALAVRSLEEMGIAVGFSHHESGPGQNEIDLRVSDALTMADSIMTLRMLLEEIALSQGVIASFMPKPLEGLPGNGMHTHFSLFEGNRNAFYDPAAEYQISITARQFIAGVLAHAREISAVTNQHVNSYKRLFGRDEAPAYITWGKGVQSALIRVPAFKPGKANSARIEYRALDSAANPYLAFAVILRAGLDGIERGLDLADPLGIDAVDLDRLERKALGIQSLPTSLHEALREMENSTLVADTLGEDAFDYFIRNKLHEWELYRGQITPFERRHFMGGR